MKSRNIYICVAVAFLSLNSCTDSWLEPKPLSFHTPEDTYVGVDGFEATLSACEAKCTMSIMEMDVPSLQR